MASNTSQSSTIPTIALQVNTLILFSYRNQNNGIRDGSLLIMRTKRTADVAIHPLLLLNKKH